MPPPPDVDIHVDHGRVGTGPAGGDRDGVIGEKIKFKKLDPHKEFQFKLNFRRDPPAPNQPDWPFDGGENPPGSASTGWVRSFHGKLQVEGTYKYDIESDDGSVPMDPRIIVGRG
jgi:hypothetical protein